MLIHPAVIARLRAVVADAFEAGTRVLVERPAFGAVIAGRLRSVERTFALAAIERPEVTARERHPDHAFRIDVAAADAKAGRGNVIDLGDRGLRRIASEHDAHDGARVAAIRAPDRSVLRVRHDGVEADVHPLVLRRIHRLIGLDIGVALAVAVGVEHERRPPLRLPDVAGLVVHLRVDPSEDVAAAAEPDGVVRVEAEFRMVRPETGVERRVLARLRIPHRGLAQRFLDRVDLRRREIRSRQTVGGILAAACGCREPHAALAIHHRVVIVDARIPDLFVVPIGGRRHRQQRRRMSRPEAERHLRIQHGRMEDRRGVLHRIEYRQVVGAVFRRSVERPVRVDGRLAFVRRDDVVQVMLVVAEALERDDDVPLDALRTLRLGARQLALGDAIGPVAEQLRAERAEREQLLRHLLSRLPGAGTAQPCGR